MSWWNPVDDVKSAVKDAKHAVSDTIETGDKLVHDAYKTAKDTVKGTVKVGGDLVKTGEKVGGDVATGNIGGAFEDAGKGVWHAGGDAIHTELKVFGDQADSLIDLGKGALKVGGDLNKFAIDTLSAVNPVLADSLRLGDVFVESAVNTGILQPLDGASQLLSAGVHELTGYKLPTLELHVTADTQGLGILGRVVADAGDAAGFIAPILLTGGATSALAGLGAGADALDAADAVSTVATVAEDGSTAARTVDTTEEGLSAASKVTKVAKFVNSPYKTAVDGAIAGFVFTPSEGKGNILESRFEAAGVNAVTFGSMDGAARVLSSSADGLLSGTESTALKTTAHLGINAVSGAAGGVANAESSSVLSGKGLASSAELTHSAEQFAITGTAMAGVHLASQQGFEAGINMRSRLSGDAPESTPDSIAPPSTEPLTSEEPTHSETEPTVTDAATVAAAAAMPAALIAIETAHSRSTTADAPASTQSVQRHSTGGDSSPDTVAQPSAPDTSALADRTTTPDPETGGYKISGPDQVTVTYDKDNNVTHVWNDDPYYSQGLRPKYGEDPATGQPELTSIEAYSINSKSGRETISTGSGFIKGNGGWYHGDIAGSPYVPIGRDLSIGPDGSVTISGKVTTPDGSQSLIGRSDDRPITKLVYNTRGGKSYEYGDGSSTNFNYNDKLIKQTTPAGATTEVTYDHGQINSIKLGTTSYVKHEDGIFYDGDTPFAKSVRAERQEIVIEPTENVRWPGAADKPLASVTEHASGLTVFSYQDGTIEQPTFKLGKETAKLDWTNHELTKVSIGDKSYVKQGGIFYDETTGKPFAKGITVKPYTLELEPVDGTRLPVPGSPDGREIEKIRTLSHDGTIAIKFKGDAPSYAYSLDRTAPEEVAHRSFINQITANDAGLRTDSDGTEVAVDSNLHETINGDKYAGAQRGKLQSIIESATSPSAREQFTRDMSTMENRLAERIKGSGDGPLTKEETTTLNNQLANTYYQLNKMLTTEPAALSFDLRTTLARQFMTEAASPELVGQGDNPTCNVTAGVQNRDFTNNPAQAAQTIASIATRGGFVTTDGHIVDLSSMPGGLAPIGESLRTVGPNSPLSVDGQRNYLSQLYQTAAVDAHWQSTTVGPSGLTVQDASTVSEVRAGEPFHAGTVRYGLDPGGQNALIDTSEPPAKLYQTTSQFSRLNPFTGKETVSNELEPITSPHLSDEQIIGAGKLLSNDKAPHYIRLTGPYDNLIGSGGIVKINSTDTLQEALLKMQKEGGLPAVLRVDTRNPIFTGQDAPNPDGHGGAHVINVQDIREVPSNSGKFVIDATNQWGSDKNYLGDDALTPEQLFQAMHEYSPEVKSVPVPAPSVSGWGAVIPGVNDIPGWGANNTSNANAAWGTNSAWDSPVSKLQAFREKINNLRGRW